MATTETECIDALQTAATLLGESPTKQQYEDLGLTPAHSTILRVMGSWNEAKDAAGLETYRSGQFGGPSVKPKPNDVTIPDETTWEDLSPYQRWYHQNKDREIAKKERRRRRHRAMVHRYKENSCECTRCGEEDPACLDFHHVDEKHMSISKMVAYGYRWDALQEEIGRCVVLCANCHRREHYDDPTEKGSQHS